jgi:hypothetical protein
VFFDVCVLPVREDGRRKWSSDNARKRAYRPRQRGESEPPILAAALGAGDELAVALERERGLLERTEPGFDRAASRSTSDHSSSGRSMICSAAAPLIVTGLARTRPSSTAVAMIVRNRRYTLATLLRWSAERSVARASDGRLGL